MTPAAIVDELIYINYRENRRLRPDVRPEEWEPLYGPKTAAMELRLYLERANEVPSGS